MFVAGEPDLNISVLASQELIVLVMKNGGIIIIMRREI